MIQRYHLENFSETRVLPIYVSLAQLSEYVKRDQDEFRVQLYARIVDACIETLETNSDFSNGDRGVIAEAISGMKRAIGLENAPTLDDIKDEISQIRSVAEELLFQLSYDLTAKSLKQTNAKTKKSTERTTFFSKVSDLFFSGGADFSSERQKERSDLAEQTVQLMGRRLVHNNAAEFIIRFLQEAQQILDLEYSLVLLDECSEASPEAQVEIFRFFKALRGCNSTIAGKNDCAFFIGTVYPRDQTHYPDRQRHGFSFEPGQDCTVEFIQWDETDVESYIEFFEQMLVSRARALLDFQGDTDSFISDYFDEASTFRLAIFCSNGIPRRFWEILRRAYDAGTDKVSKNRLKIATQEIVSEQILSHHYLSEEDQATAQYVVKIVAARNEESRVKNRKSGGGILPQGVYFSILPRNIPKLSSLIMQGAVHDKSRMKSRRQSLRPHPVFALDIAVAYAFRAIPERDFEKVAARDFPRAPSNGFANAASFEPPKSKRPGRASSKVAKEPRSNETPEKTQFSTESVPTTIDVQMPYDGIGYISQIRKNGSGAAFINDGGNFAYIPKEIVNELIRAGAEEGSPIKAQLIPNEKGREITKAEIFEELTLSLTDSRREEIESIIQELLEEGDPVRLTKVAQRLRSHFGDIITGTVWFGYGRMHRLIDALELDYIEMDTSSANAFITRKK